MKVVCVSNKALDLKPYEYDQTISDGMLGRFGATNHTEYGEITVGREYLFMGIIIFNSYQAYLLDDNGLISACPCQLFKITDSQLNPEWFFRSVETDEEIYPYIQALIGYKDFCKDKNSYEELIIEKNSYASRKYLKQKIEWELYDKSNSE